MSSKSLKAGNTPILWAVVSFDVVVVIAIEVGLLLTQQVQLSRITLWRILLTAVAPVLVLFLNNLLSARLKAVLVYWRVRHVLPGHRAFSVLALRDPRIDLGKLERNVGPFPKDARDQNTKWYGLLKRVEAEPEISHAHSNFLLLRDVAALSLLLLGCVVVSALLGFVGMTTWAPASAFLGAQYLLSAIGARHQGNGLVTSVLALHSTEPRV